MLEEFNIEAYLYVTLITNQQIIVDLLYCRKNIYMFKAMQSSNIQYLLFGLIHNPFFELRSLVSWLRSGESNFPI